MNSALNSLFAAHALLPGGWARDVHLSWNDLGQFTSVKAQTGCPPGTTCASGPVLPGMVNLHSHAFQRALSGLTECRGCVQDNFWSWRSLMYRIAAAITPEQLEAIATGLYVEMLEAGYTSVCEFHYLHHDCDGHPYADDATLSLCLLRAAARSGIGLTFLPVLYQTSGFGASASRPDQRRFVRSTDNMLALQHKLEPLCVAQGARLGLAPHSLRAVFPDSLREVVAGLHAIDPLAPVHIHIAEQMAEVDACLAWSGQRPVQWLLNHAQVDARWCLVHATHMTPDESARAARTGAVAGLCPSTEANLGDGIFDAASWLHAGGCWGIGSDSHACVNAAEELMLLEYSQRLATRQRNVLANAAHACVATAMTLDAVTGGARASARSVAGLVEGQQADMVMLDAQHPLLRELPSPDAMLSTHVFASHRQSALQQVWVAGCLRVQSSRHHLHESALSALVAARQELLRSTA